MRGMIILMGIIGLCAMEVGIFRGGWVIGYADGYAKGFAACYKRRTK